MKNLEHQVLAVADEVCQNLSIGEMKFRSRMLAGAKNPHERALAQRRINRLQGNEQEAPQETR